MEQLIKPIVKPNISVELPDAWKGGLLRAAYLSGARDAVMGCAILALFVFVLFLRRKR